MSTEPDDDQGLREVLRRNEGMFRTWFDCAGVGIAQIESATGRFVRVNRVYGEIVGYTPAEMEQMDFLSITLPEDLEPDLVQLRRLLAGETRVFSLEKRYVHKQGNIVWVALTVTPLWGVGEKPRHHLAIVQDITERKRVEEERELIFERISEGFIALDNEWRYTFVNEHAAHMLGRAREDLLGRVLWELFPEAVDTEFHRATVKAMQDQTPVTMQSYFAPWDRWYENRIFPSPEGISVYFKDITARVTTERLRGELERQGAQRQRLDALGRLAGGVAHDMNNVLAAILGIASEQVERQWRDGASREAFETIVTACRRGGDIVRGLLEFSRDRPAREVPVDVNALVEEQMRLLRSTALVGVQVDLELTPSLPCVVGDPTALARVLMNLFVNACDAMPSGGQLSVRTRLDGREVVVEVTDTGHGMPEEVLERAFEPFFTTKSPGRGTGLGLAIAFRTARTHGGRLELSSTIGRGTCATLRLPASDVSPEARGEPAPPEAASTTITVLVVDDDDGVRRALVRMLERLGCVVKQASSAADGLALVERGLRPRLVVLDLVMPGMSGIEALPRFRGLAPDVPILLSSGQAEQDMLDRIAGYAGVQLLLKPYGIEELRGAVRRAVAPC
jgi:PAS domain S-box-containing protein